MYEQYICLYIVIFSTVKITIIIIIILIKIQFLNSHFDGNNGSVSGLFSNM